MTGGVFGDHRVEASVLGKDVVKDHRYEVVFVVVQVKAVANDHFRLFEADDMRARSPGDGELNGQPFTDLTQNFRVRHLIDLRSQNDR